PAEFEVADVKPTVPGAVLATPGFFGIMPGGRVNLPRLPLRLVISIAWNLNQEDIPGAPKWLDTAQVDIIAKDPAELARANSAQAPIDDLGPMLQALLKDRFKMQTHYEDRPVTAYTLVAAKPKLKKADPSSRIGCKQGNATSTVNLGQIQLPQRLV